MMRFSPTIKISFGLVLVTVSLLLFGDLIGVVPDEDWRDAKNSASRLQYSSPSP